MILLPPCYAGNFQLSEPRCFLSNSCKLDLITSLGNKHHKDDICVAAIQTFVTSPVSLWCGSPPEVHHNRLFPVGIISSRHLLTRSLLLDLCWGGSQHQIPPCTTSKSWRSPGWGLPHHKLRRQTAKKECLRTGNDTHRLPTSHRTKIGETKNPTGENHAYQPHSIMPPHPPGLNPGRLNRGSALPIPAFGMAGRRFGRDPKIGGAGNPQGSLSHITFNTSWHQKTLCGPGDTDHE